MSEPFISFKATASAELDRRVLALPNRTRTAIIKRAMKAAAQPIRDVARAHVGGSGILRESIEFKISSKDNGRLVRCFIGPSRDVMVPVAVHKGGLGLPPFVAIPTRYAHLVEFGHDIVRNGKVIGHVGPKAFMRPAWLAEGADVALFHFKEALEAELATALTA